MVKTVIKKRTAVAAIIAAVFAIFATCAIFIGCSKSNEVNEYVVVFFSDGGTEVPSQTVSEGDKVKRPEAPTKAGYSFGGWYSDIELTELWKFDLYTVGGDTILYAKWTNSDGSTDDQTADSTNNCIVMFFENGGSAVPSQRVAMGDKITLPKTPTRAGMIFDGWYKDKDFTEIWKFDEYTVTQKSTILYAKWIEDPDYSDGNSGGDNNSGGNGGNTDGDDNNTGDNTGDDNNTGGENDDDDDIISGSSVVVTFNVGLAARKLGLSNPPAVTVESGSKLTAPTVSLNNYTLDGWYAEDGTTAWNFASDKVSNNTTLYARWTASSSDYIPSLQNANTLYIHYLRTNGDYTNWSLWVWSDNSVGKRYTCSDRDTSGIIFAIPISSYGGTSGKVNFKPGIISDSGEWSGSDGNDASVLIQNAGKVGNSYHWYIREGETVNGAAYFLQGSLYENTEAKRVSVSDVNRSYAANLPVAKTVTGCDEMGIGYQIFVASFCDSNGDGVGDIRGIINKLDYLASLNVDVLWLTPIQSSNSYHGYDCYDYYSVDPKFGTNADYRELVYKAHQKGMKIIMDLVVNHTSPDNEWFIKSKAGVIETVTYQDGTTAEVKYRDFYRWTNIVSADLKERLCNAGDGWYFYSSFGDSMPELNYDCQAVRNAMSDVAAYWMNFGLDGFRMDAIKHLFMWDESENKAGDIQGGAYDVPYNYNLTKDVEFFKEFNYKLKAKYPNCFLLGEQLSGDVNDVSPFYAGMDSLFDFNTYYDMPKYISNSAASSAANVLNSNAALYRQYRADRPINSMISSNHDIPRLSSLFDSTQKIKLYFAITMTMPGLSWIYYGDEIGLIGPSGGGDRNYRQSMKWTSTWSYGCQNTISGKELNGSTVSVAEQETDSNSLLSYVKLLGSLRNSHPALINGTATCSEQDGMLKITVVGSTETLTVYHNFNSTAKSVGGNVIFGSTTVSAYGTTVVKQ